MSLSCFCSWCLSFPFVSVSLCNPVSFRFRDFLAAILFFPLRRRSLSTRISFSLFPDTFSLNTSMGELTMSSLLRSQPSGTRSSGLERRALEFDSVSSSLFMIVLLARAALEGGGGATLIGSLFSDTMLTIAGVRGTLRSLTTVGGTTRVSSTSGPIKMAEGLMTGWTT